MELRHLRYFIAAAEEEHFGRASDRLHVTRPAVSQIIADLEDEIGTPLFERLAHRVRLTEAGKTLLPQVQALLNQLGQAVLATQRVGQGKSGTLSIGYGSLTLLNSLFRAAIKQYKEAYPDVTLSLHEISTTDQFRALADGKLDAGFMHFGPGRVKVRKGPGSNLMSQDETVLDWFHIQTGSLGVALPTDHRLAQRKSVTLSDLAGERFVVVPQSVSSPGYGPLYTLCQEAGFEPDVVQEVKTISTQLNLISVGIGIGLAVTGRNFIYPNGITVVPLQDVSHATSFVLAWVKDKMDPALERLLDIVKLLAK
ncbi:LysR family transcriptional regulator [Ideonella azotifigens]|uniref:LysR substrate-binding domain-containing protein n=1 Tax=Ideonella azotifigens TaxID=513160 RepID=A0ABP3V6R2_9BURK|nr:MULTISPECIES: LysR substrate-binding domain-containing protein [Ideonella]MCD2341498.1 LysR family transcriptional regulator [Ideonella azotifigens]HSI47101.1 LysR substrate-binding domain-containing protein [Ideonella sp.]